MAKEKQYIVRLESGEEIGPAEAEVLIKLAQNGTITSTAKVRSKLIPEWNRASEIDFLKEIIFRQQQTELAEQAHNQSFKEKMLERMTAVAPQQEGRAGLVKVNVETLPPASPVQRIFAGVFDLVILGIIICGIFFGGQACLENKVFEEDGTAVTLTVMASLFVVLAYFSIMIGCFTQTVGQRFWGLFLIRTNGKPFWIGRVFFFSVFLVIFGLLTPFFLIAGAKTFQELLTGTRLAKVLVARKN